MNAQRDLAELRARFEAVQRGVHLLQRVGAVDHGPEAGALHKGQQVAELVEIAQRGPQDLQLADEDAAQIGTRLVAEGLAFELFSTGNPADAAKVAGLALDIAVPALVLTTMAGLRWLVENWPVANDSLLMRKAETA